MESPNPETAGAKRKRSPVEENAAAARQIPLMPAGHGMGTGVGIGGVGPANVTQINYLMKAKSERLRLIEGDSDTFADVLGMIDDYEVVLQRHESLAANLGAKLVGPLVLKSFDKLFDGPIRIIQDSYEGSQSPVTWLDIVTFSRTRPAEFTLNHETAQGARACRFWIRGGQVEISEDDYRLIMSGGPERMIPTHPIAEDESAELATLNILEVRLAMLIKKADAVARKARQLNYHLKGRKAAVLSSKVIDQPGSIASEEARTFSPQPFSAINSTSPAPVNGEAVKLQQHLLEQFMASSRHPSTVLQPRPKASRIPSTESSGSQALNSSHQEADGRRMSHPRTTSLDDSTEVHRRVLMTARIEKIGRGSPIYPPCDRCRRLKFECTKHLTACSACTKKHAKCSWNIAKEGEFDETAPFVASHGQMDGGENGYSKPDRQQENLDPGLRAAIEQQHGEARFNTHASEFSERRALPDMESDHAVLTQIASAAAATGSR